MHLRSTGKIEHEWTGDNRHFNDLQFVVSANQLGHIEAEDLRDANLVQSLIHGTFSLKWFRFSMRFDGGFASGGLLFSHINDTGNPEAEPLREWEIDGDGSRRSAHFV